MKLTIKCILGLAIILGVSTGVLALNKPKGSSVYSIPARTYPDRDGISLRLPAKDQGIILKYGDNGDVNGARDASIYSEKGKYYLTYDGAGFTSWESNEALSTDLTHWKKIGPILNHGPQGSLDAASADYGTIFKYNGHYDMFYLGTPNQGEAPANVPTPPYYTLDARSDSPTGPWNKVSTVPFTLDPHSYYATSASPGSIARQGNQYMMFISVGNNGTRTISVARTNDPEGKWKIDPQPILPVSQQIENASLYYQASDSTWFMFVNHIGKDPTGHEYSDAIWVYWTHDLNKWSTKNKAIVIDDSVCKWSYPIIGLPSVTRVGNRLAIIYDGRTRGYDYSYFSNNHTQRDIGLAWVNLPINAK